MKILLERYRAVVSIDDADLPEFGRHRWCVSKRGNTRYVSRNDGGKCVFLHRQLLRAPKGMDVDHIDGNGLNNSRDNLRIVSHRENLWNMRLEGRSVGLSKRREQWRAKIIVGGHDLELGSFRDRGEAERARDIASLILRGEIGSLNNPGVGEHVFSWIMFAPKAREILRAAAGA